MKTQSKVLTKKLIIQALKTEPLKPGSWFASTKGENFKTCKVSAVGAVIRHSFTTQQIRTLHVHNRRSLCLAMQPYWRRSLDRSAAGWGATMMADLVDQQVTAELDKKNYLGALSMWFEFYYQHVEFKRLGTREGLVDFVRKNFPTRFKVTVDVDAGPY